MHKKSHTTITLQFNENIEIHDIFRDYRKEIFESVVNSIKDNYKNSEIININVVNINTGSKNYIIDLSRDKFVSTLYKCISFYENLEMYEDCQTCVDIIREIEEK